MSFNREHLENGGRRVVEGKERIEKQREIVARLSLQERTTRPEALLLDTATGTKG